MLIIFSSLLCLVFFHRGSLIPLPDLINENFILAPVDICRYSLDALCSYIYFLHNTMNLSGTSMIANYARAYAIMR